MITNHSEQISRIKSKLIKARRADVRFKVFGADVHNYRLGKPVPLSEIREFEQEYQINLPDDYVAFLQEIGDVKGTKLIAVAGPFYGLFSFRSGVGAKISGKPHYLAQSTQIHPDMSDSDWQIFVENNFISDGPWNLNGVLTLGTQGCGLYHGLMISGEYKGRIINCDDECLDVCKPIFSHEASFLDWYERWLDEVISGLLVQNKGYLFGCVMRGSEIDLLQIISKSQSQQGKLDALNGFTLIASVGPSTLESLRNFVEVEEAEVKYLALRMLTKFDFDLAQPYLKNLIAGGDADCKAACESVFKYAKSKAGLFKDDISRRLLSIEDKGTYRFAMYVLDEINSDLSEVIAAGLSHSDVDIRVSSAYHLGKQKFYPNLVPYFILGLRDDEHRVVHASLQALKGSKDISFLEPYYHIATSYVWDDTYVLTNLEHRLGEIGFRSVPYFKKCYEAGKAETEFKKYTSGNGILNYFRRALSK